MGVAQHMFDLSRLASRPLETPVWPTMPKLTDDGIRDWQCSGNGSMVCPCELVTRREVEAALTGPTAAQSPDGLKRRAKVTMGRCSDPAYFATGNPLRAVETAGWCWSEGQRAAAAIALDLAGKAAAAPQLRIRAEGEALKYVLPQRLGSGAQKVQFRVTRPVQGRLTLSLKSTEIQSCPLTARPEHRRTLSLSALPAGARGELVLRIAEGAT